MRHIHILLIKLIVMLYAGCWLSTWYCSLQCFGCRHVWLCLSNKDCSFWDCFSAWGMSHLIHLSIQARLSAVCAFSSHFPPELQCIVKLSTYLPFSLGCLEVETERNGNWWTANWSYLFMHGKTSKSPSPWTTLSSNLTSCLCSITWRFLQGLQKIYTCVLALSGHKRCYGLSTTFISQFIIYDAGMSVLYLPSYSLFWLLSTVSLVVDLSISVK